MGEQTRPFLSLQRWEGLGLGTPGSRPQVAWLLLTVLGYPGRSSWQCGRGGCPGVGHRHPGWGGMVSHQCRPLGSCLEAAELTPPAQGVAAGGKRAVPAVVCECGPDSPSSSRHICTWFTVNESPVLMNWARAPLPPGPLAWHPDTEPGATP